MINLSSRVVSNLIDAVIIAKANLNSPNTPAELNMKMEELNELEDILREYHEAI